ncbi:hypothetical protein B0T19DRAFT_484554 [Cercophora scortea]|uniref:Uncharacterized protein n=1 Tax=Cercophora scortea TaxID=314031 RepID=A0AAE0ILZ5_9PEZI|nr:hypothetical protein B0T19DRAFT_484554 [Cercophora scortea]
MSTVSPCPIAGNPQLYGLGIRIAFYLLWLGILVSNLLIEEGTGVRVLRAAHLVFSSAVVLGLAMSAAAASTAAMTLVAPEVYVMILLVSTTAYFLVPLYLFRLASGCRPEWDPLAYVGDGHLRFVFGNGRKRSDESEHSPFGFDPIVAGENMLWLVVAGVQLWFWCAGVEALGVEGCVQYGFLFAQVELGGEGFRAFNILVVLGLLGGTMALAVLDTGRRGRRRRRRRRRRRVSSAHKTILANLQYFSDLGVVVIVIAAVELSIKWNNISAAVNQVSSAAQLIPVLISALLLLIMMRHWATDKFGDGDDDGGEDDGDSGESGRCAKVGRKPDPSSSSSSSSGGVRGVVPRRAPGGYFGPVPVMGAEPPPESVVTTSEEEQEEDNQPARGGGVWTGDGDSDRAPYRVVINPPARVTEPLRVASPDAWERFRYQSPESSSTEKSSEDTAPGSPPADDPPADDPPADDPPPDDPPPDDPPANDPAADDRLADDPPPEEGPPPDSAALAAGSPAGSPPPESPQGGGDSPAGGAVEAKVIEAAATNGVQEVTIEAAVATEVAAVTTVAVVIKLSTPVVSPRRSPQRPSPLRLVSPTPPASAPASPTDPAPPGSPPPPDPPVLAPARARVYTRWKAKVQTFEVEHLRNRRFYPVIITNRPLLEKIRSKRETLNNIIADYKLFTHHNSAKLDFPAEERHRLSSPKFSQLEGLTADEGNRLQKSFLQYEIFTRLYGRPFFCFLLADDDPAEFQWTECRYFRELQATEPREYDALLSIHEYVIARSAPIADEVVHAVKMGVVEFRDRFVQTLRDLDEEHAQLGDQTTTTPASSISIADIRMRDPNSLLFLCADDKKPGADSHSNGLLMTFASNTARVGLLDFFYSFISTGEQERFAIIRQSFNLLAQPRIRYPIPDSLLFNSGGVDSANWSPPMNRGDRSPVVLENLPLTRGLGLIF